MFNPVHFVETPIARRRRR